MPAQELYIFLWKEHSVDIIKVKTLLVKIVSLFRLIAKYYTPQKMKVQSKKFSITARCDASIDCCQTTPSPNKTNYSAAKEAKMLSFLTLTTSLVWWYTAPCFSLRFLLLLFGRLCLCLPRVLRLWLRLLYMLWMRWRPYRPLRLQ